jgi:hypothetical protein
MKHQFTISKLVSFLSNQGRISQPVKVFSMVLGFLWVTISVTASTFTCETPTAGGTFTISLKSFTDNCGPISVHIPAGSTAAQKASLIAARINNSCVGVFTATANGADVTVLNAVHPGQRVFFKFGKDDTGEKDKIEKSLQPSWWDEFWGATAPIYTCAGPASGVAVDGTSPGKIYIGTSTHVAEVTTIPGQSSFDILNDAKFQLMLAGVENVVLAEVLPGMWGLSFKVQPEDTFVEFGDNDTGVECSFEMFEPASTVFHQLDFNYDGTITNNSEWGAVDVTFIGTDQIMYLNLTVDTAWVIENMPVLSTKGAGIEQTQRFWFDIGDPGIPVGLLTQSLTLTPAISGKPDFMTNSPVTTDWVVINTGFSGGPPGGGGPAPAGKQKGGQALDPAPKLHKNFPNQESPTNFCVPAGVSNSLQWLNTKNGLGMNPNDISIPSLGNAFGTTPGNGTLRDNIYKNKKAYCKKKKLPITTRKFSGSRIGDVAKEIKNGQDVEMMVSWIGGGGKGHCVAVTGITDHGNGKFSLVITHDKEQNQAGGTVDENATYDKNTKKWGGALSKASGASNDIVFIVECPVVKSKQTTTGLPGGDSHTMVQDASITYDNGKYVVTNLDISGYSSINPPPPLGGLTFFSVNSIATLELSLDSGDTFMPVNAPCQMFMRMYHDLDSGGVEYYQTEILQMTLQGGSLPPNIFIRESMLLGDSSTGVLRMRPVPGGFQIDSFFDIFTELSVDGRATWLPDDDETTVLYANGPTVLPYVSLQNVFIGFTESVCYDATQSIFVGGDGPFVVPPGGQVTMIAGQSIHFFDGTLVMPGGYLYAYISPDGQYCSEYQGNPPTSPVHLTATSQPGQEINFSNWLKVYPNPAYSSFTVELTDGQASIGDASVNVFDMNGIRVAAHTMKGERVKEISLAGYTPGVYFIHVITGRNAKTVKLVKY